MPELPEVETARRGIARRVLGRRITGVDVRQPSLRWPVPAALGAGLTGQVVRRLERRGKYLLLGVDTGTALIHLGMSGSLRVLSRPPPPGPHDHVDIAFDDGAVLRLTDPRRFGALLWTEAPPASHPLLAHLGPEPLSPAFTGAYLHARSRGRRTSVKAFLLDGRVVAGIGNIYASEALFLAGIHPRRAAGRIALTRYEHLAAAIRCVLEESIAQGGTTLRDFVDGEGRPGYYLLRLRVYGRGGEPCPRCGTPLRDTRLAQRGSVHCPRCQR